MGCTAGLIVVVVVVVVVAVEKDPNVVSRLQKIISGSGSDRLKTVQNMLSNLVTKDRTGRVLFVMALRHQNAT